MSPVDILNSWKSRLGIEPVDFQHQKPKEDRLAP